MPGFAPEALTVKETNPATPFLWRVTPDLTYTDRQSKKFATGMEFDTDFASVPLIMTWLVPRYGLYTKAAVIHDKLCQRGDFDRFDADQLFNEMMKALGVPWLRRLLLFSAVTWPAMIGHVVTIRVGIVAVPIFTILSTLLLAQRWRGWALVLAGFIAFLLWIGITTVITAPIVRWKAVAKCYLGTGFGSLFIVPALALLPFLGFYIFIENPREAMWKVAGFAILVMKVLNGLIPGQEKPRLVDPELEAALSTPRIERIQALFGLD